MIEWVISHPSRILSAEFPGNLCLAAALGREVVRYKLSPAAVWLGWIGTKAHTVKIETNREVSCWAVLNVFLSH